MQGAIKMYIYSRVNQKAKKLQRITSTFASLLPTHLPISKMKSLRYANLLLASLLPYVQAAPATALASTSTLSSTPASTSTCIPSNLTYITLEEHYDSPASIPAQAADGIYAILSSFLTEVLKYTSDIDKYRIPSMNENGIKMSVCWFENIFFYVTSYFYFVFFYSDSIDIIPPALPKPPLHLLTTYQSTRYSPTTPHPKRYQTPPSLQ